LFDANNEYLVRGLAESLEGNAMFDLNPA